MELNIAALIAVMFWHQDWQYSLPTPRPAELQSPELLTVIDLPALNQISGTHASERPVLLHFFNPDCPCSRFNLDHVRALHERFGDRVNFVAVLEGSGLENLRQQYARLNLPIPEIVDGDRSIARLTGVFATPQAVILDRDHRLLYRGNYNSGRYCTAPESEFARLALEAMLDKRESEPTFPAAATTTYGCQLPVCAVKGMSRE